MSLQVELCEHLARNLFHAAERTKEPQTRKLLLKHTVLWVQDALAALKQSRAARRTRPSWEPVQIVVAGGGSAGLRWSLLGL